MTQLIPFRVNENRWQALEILATTSEAKELSVYITIDVRKMLKSPRDDDALHAKFISLNEHGHSHVYEYSSQL